MKNILITGASRGIGKATALQLGKNKNYRIIVNYEKNKDLAENVVEEIRHMGQDAIAIGADVADYDKVKAMHEKIKEQFGPVDILINNAGIAKCRLFQEIPPEDWKRIFDVNVHGMYNNIQQVLPSMISRKEGEIINISSIWGLCGGAMESDYAATKAAIISLTKSLAKECSYSGIRINAIAPGAVDTDMLHQLSDEVLDQVVDETPLGRLGKVEDVANLIEFMLSEKCRFMTGQIISPNGGFVIL
ncbi:MAG: 3-oxoacyl-ACP reductase FabG [Tissierellia bacterium]|nr:3-oxoacyl-ACP reductase FabG [Tissierellia bacterium]